MSYSISVYPIQLLEKTQELNLTFDDVFDFLEKEENLIDFSYEQLDKIDAHLIYRGYKSKGKSKSRKDYTNKKHPSVSVMLTKNGLFFNARGEDVMEITMTALDFKSSYGLKGFFAVFDSQNKGWQE